MPSQIAYEWFEMDQGYITSQAAPNPQGYLTVNTILSVPAPSMATGCTRWCLIYATVLNYHDPAVHSTLA
jgi:hypothetical protein